MAEIRSAEHTASAVFKSFVLTAELTPRKANNGHVV